MFTLIHGLDKTDLEPVFGGQQEAVKHHPFCMAEQGGGPGRAVI